MASMRQFHLSTFPVAIRFGLALALGALFTFGPTEESSAQSVIDLFAACRGKYGVACFAYAIDRDGVALRESPRVSAPVIQTIPMTMTILLLEPFERDGWIRAQTQPEDGTDAREAWVQRSDVAMAWDF